MVLTRIISPEDFGKVGTLSIFFVVANTLMDAGLGGSLIKESHLTKRDCSTISSFNVTVSLFLYCLLFLFAPLIESFYGVEGLAKVSRLLCLIFVINSFGLVPRALLTRNLRFKTLSIISIISVTVAAIVSIILAFNDYRVYALIAYQVTNSICNVLISTVVSGYWVSFGFSSDSFKRLFKFGVFTTISTTIDTIYENLTTTLFGKFLNMQEAGYLHQAKRLEEFPSQGITTTISNVSFPVLTKLRDDRTRFNAECNSTFKIVLLLLTPLLLSIALYSKPIIVLLFGDMWIPAAPYLSVLIWASVFQIAETLVRSFIKASCEVELLLKYTVIKRIIGIVIILVFLFIDPPLALYGYVISSAIGYIINLSAFSKIAEVQMSNSISLFLRYIFPGCCYYLISYFLNNHLNSLLSQIIISAFLLFFYYFGLLKLYGIDLKENIYKDILKKSR